jgi:hypothetical protein
VTFVCAPLRVNWWAMRIIVSCGCQPQGPHHASEPSQLELRNSVIFPSDLHIMNEQRRTFYITVWKLAQRFEICEGRSRSLLISRLASSWHNQRRLSGIVLLLFVPVWETHAGNASDALSTLS